MESRRNKLEEVELKVVPMKSNDKIKEFSKIKVSEVDNEKDKEVKLERDIRPTIYLDVLDTYYGLDEEELFDDTEFVSNKEQENAFEVLLKEVATECDTLVQKLARGEKEPTREPRSKINADEDEEKNSTEIVDNLKVLTEKEKLDRACEVWVKKVKEFQGTATRNNGKVEEPTERIFDGIYGEVKKNEDKEVKIEMELLLTYPKLVTVDNTENVRDPEGGQTEIEIEKDGNKVFEIDEEEAWKTEEEEKVKIERKGRIRISSNIEHENGRVDDDNRKADECKTYHNTTSMDNGGTVKDDNDNKTVVEEDEDIAVDIEKRLTEKKRNHAYNELTAKKERKTLAGNDDDKKEEKNAGTEKSLKKETLSRVCEKKRLGLDDGVEEMVAVDKFENNHIQPEDQFQGSMVRGMDICVKSNRSDGIILVRKMVDDEKEGRESGGLPELDRITIQNIECAKNGEVVTPEVDEFRRTNSEVNKTTRRELAETEDRSNDELGVRIEEACEWYLKSTEDANSADQFDPGGSKIR
ncbi:hypothetical protein C2G38_2168078 [Gigaspora rosea]|uniref:Uncharacterized protein n=1 Tax=Gigaspora rosea TaxID=44941 RepID=A0A397VSD6_9GLOM|nr:hypothetical protein C2G38_2168078 [Gigaspora rosea]